MIVLGIDTASSIASVALVEGDRLLAERLSPSRAPQTRTGSSGPKSNHAEVILPLVDSVLRRAGAALADVAAIAVSIGPGSFTGVRIGLSTAMGLAYGAGMAAVGISTLHANAARVTAGFEGVVCACLDARKKEVYAALFRISAGIFQRLTPDAILTVPALIQTLHACHGGAPCVFIGDGATAHRDLLAGAPGMDAQFADDQVMPSVASAVARLSQPMIVANEAASATQLAPVYLRRPECESHLKVALN